MKQKTIICLGGPGSGKTFQSEIIEKLIDNSVHISTGQIIRKSLNNDNYIKKISKGTLLKDSEIFQLLENTLKIKKIQNSKLLILDGFPRTINQFKKSIELFDILGLVIFKMQSKKIILERLSKRLEKENRHDDYEKTIITRIDIYNKFFDLLFYKKNTNILKNIPVSIINAESTKLQTLLQFSAFLNSLNIF